MSAARDEDTLAFPAAWRRLVHPRRSGVRVPAKKADKKAAQSARELLDRTRDAVDTVLESSDTRPIPGEEHLDPEVRDLVARARGHRDGTPDPAGAAALAVIAQAVGEPDRRAGVREYAGLARFAEHWLAVHGAAFAACALVEACVTRLVWRTNDDPGGLRVGGDVDDVFPLVREVLLRMRRVLAAADDREYGAAVAALAGHRRTPSRRLLVSYLVPDRHDWVAECCQMPIKGGQERFLLEHSLGSRDHIALLDRPLDLSWGDSFDRMITLVDALGTGLLPDLVAFQAAYGHRNTADDHRRFLDAVAVLPCDEAFGVLLSWLDDGPHVRAALVAAMERFPVRALRLLPPATDDPRVLDLLTEHVRAWPEPATAVLPDLPPESRTVVETVAASVARVGQAPAASLPPALTDPAPEGPAVKLPGWAAPAVLPQILMPDGRAALPDGAAGRLLSVLMAPGNALGDPVLEAVRAACDRRSLAAFGWAVFEKWRGKGLPSKHRWALAQLGPTGDDETARRLAPLIRRWHEAGSHARALAGLDALAAMESDAALEHLFDLDDNGPSLGFRFEAQQRIVAIGDRLGLHYQQLRDRLIPDFGLDAGGGRTLDYGPRRFTVAFDERLTPFVIDGTGRRLKALPKPGAKDDPDLAKAAHEHFADLKAGVRGVASEQVKRLESAMLADRRWSPEEFRTLYLRHPLLRHIARRLVWISDQGDAPVAFRVTEDGTLADVRDDAFDLPPQARIRLAHPATLGGDLDAWSATFDDYEIAQPFEQLGRARYVLTEAERAGARLARFEGAVVQGRAALRLTRRDWRRGDPVENDWAWMFRPARGGLNVMVDLSPGILGGRPAAEQPDQTVERVRIDDEPDPYRPGRAVRRTFGDLDPVTASEILADLTELAASQRRTEERRAGRLISAGGQKVNSSRFTRDTRSANPSTLSER